MRACLLLLIAVALCAVGCGDGSPVATRPPQSRVTLAERKAIFNDWYADGRIDGVYSCAVAQDAFRRLPTDSTYSLAPSTFKQYEKRVC